MRRFDREGSRNTPIAIVGMSCRLPGASDLDGLWGVLERGERRFEPLPRERWNPEFDAVELPPGFEPRACERGGLLPEANFDWRTLRIPPAQAKRMHRMELAALSTMVDAMRDASIEPTGVAIRYDLTTLKATSLGPLPKGSALQGRGSTTAQILFQMAGIEVPPDGKIPAAVADDLGRALDSIDVAIEPDRRYGSSVPRADEQVFVFKAQGGGAVDAARAPFKAMRAQVAANPDDLEAAFRLSGGLMAVVSPSTRPGRIAAGPALARRRRWPR